MKHFEIIFEREIEHEQYYANIPGDEGAETYMGIARAIFPGWDGWILIDAYKKANGPIPHNTHIDRPEIDRHVLEHYREYWKKCGMNMIENFSIQYILFDFAVNSVRTWAKKTQALLGVTTDGIIGRKTCAAINAQNPEHLFRIIKYYRINYYKKLAEKPNNAQFLKGWLKRIESINYEE